jgi:c-di-GMP phosphodiesterase
MTSLFTAPPDVFVARQPVYDPRLRVVGYELLVQGDEAGAISELGLSLVAGHPAYIPLTRSFLLEGFAAALPADRAVLCTGADLELDPAARGAIEDLVADGYKLALMDFEAGGASEPLLPLASVTGLAVPGVDRAVLRSRISHVQSRGSKALARGVERHEDLEMCLELGFDLLQGHFICQPRVVTDAGLKVMDVNRVRLLAELHGDDADLESILEIIGRDIALSYNLLRFINSAFFSLPRRVDSLRDALVLLGALNVRKWATLMAVADSQDKPRELVITGLVRARMCELLAGVYAHRDAEGAFTTGLFSVVDALTDSSMVELLSTLPLSREIIAALLNYEGTKGRILRAAIAYERGNFAELGDLPPSRIPLSDLYAQAVEWATEASGGLPA